MGMRFFLMLTGWILVLSVIRLPEFERDFTAGIRIQVQRIKRYYHTRSGLRQKPDHHMAG